MIGRYKSRIKTAIVIGAEREPVLAALAENAPDVPVLEITQSEDVMMHVVAAAKSVAASGDTVLLAPAAASMDQFKDYSDRGNSFTQQVRVQVDGAA